MLRKDVDDGRAIVGRFNEYREREADWSGEKKKNKNLVVGDNFHDWHKVLNVAPITDYEEEHFNSVKNSHPEFIFLDVGRWKGNARDFGVVWGRHVYLCFYETERNEKYIPERGYYPGDQFIDSGSYRQGLDLNFFKSNWSGRIRIQAHTRADWGYDSEYSWDHIYVIIPDLHLMSVENAKKWYSFMPPKRFNLEAEIDLMDFVEDLRKINKEKLRVIQIGDSYDLWVGLGRNLEPNSPKTFPLFDQNDYENMIIPEEFTMYGNNTENRLKDSVKIHNTRKFLLDGIHKIQTVSLEDLNHCNQGDLLNNTFYKEYGVDKKLARSDKPFLNPAEVAMRRLEDYFSDDGKKPLKDEMTYIYGNHDNYLIDSRLCYKAELQARKAYLADKALFVEHGHRMEAIFIHLHGHYPTNEDGSITGFITTNELFYHIIAKSVGIVEGPMAEEYADWIAGWSDQPDYHREFAKFWLGRKSHDGEKTYGKKPPSIFVIGHTHMPELYNMKIRLSITDFVEKRHQKI